MLFYPYLLMDFEVKYRGKLERLSEHVLVMCDMWRGQYSMARSRGEFVMTEVEEGMLIPARIDKMKAIKDAPRTVYGEIQKAKRVLNIPDIEY